MSEIIESSEKITGDTKVVEEITYQDKVKTRTVTTYVSIRNWEIDVFEWNQRVNATFVHFLPGKHWDLEFIVPNLAMDLFYVHAHHSSRKFKNISFQEKFRLHQLAIFFPNIYFILFTGVN